MTILFLNLQITRYDIRPHIKWAVSLVIAYGYLICLGGLCGYVWVDMLTLSLPRGVLHIALGGETLILCFVLINDSRLSNDIWCHV